ncbi:MAG: hypothetical protein E3J35_06265 [Methanomassiliicoccales archaeon]|nr:MAG: hypothetical protein E3J35_06265 [Methanomassiliicoccales archaeon]
MKRSPQRLLPEIERKLKEITPYNYHAIRTELLQRILRKIDQPEEKVRYFWVQRLIHEYNYESRQIEIEVPAGIEADPSKPMRADIVVYRDFERTEPFIEGEVEPPRSKKDIAKAEGYARNLGAEYYFWSNLDKTLFFRTSPYPRKSTPIGNIPYWMERKPVLTRLPKTHILPAFKSEQKLKAVMRTCHDLIWAKEGHDPAKAFDELCKLLFLKLYDERETPNYYEFVVLGKEEPKETAGRVRKLFDRAKKSTRYRDVFESKFTKAETVTLELDDYTIWQVVQQLQSYNLLETTENIKGADIKGYVFEEMVGSTFRGELGQFFTARTLVDYMVRMLNPSSNDRIIDPACGSAGFLIMTIRHVKDRIKREMPNLGYSEIKDKIRYFAENNLFGTDINDRMARVAKMNMIMHGDGHSGIFNLNGLYLNEDAPEYTKKEIREGTFQCALSNPPFAGVEKEPSVLEKFELGMRKGKPISVTKEVLFIERIIKLLDWGGKAGIVLPQGIYSVKSLRYVRDYIKKHCKILALIALPIWAFRPSGTGVRGSLLFLEKVKEVPEDYEIFVKKVDHIGFDSRGKHDVSDFDTVLEAYRGKTTPDDWITFRELDRCLGHTNTGRIDPKYFVKDSREVLKMFEGSPYDLERLGKVADFSKERYNPKKEPEKDFLYVEINDIDVRNGKIRRRFRKGKGITQSTITVHEGQILVSRRWPDRGAIAVVPKDFEGALLVREVSALTVKEGANREYLYYLFRTRQFLDLMDVYATGEMSQRISEEDLKRIRIPVPPLSVQESIATDILKRREKAEELRKQAEEIEDEGQRALFDQLELKKVPEKPRRERVTYTRI